MSIRVNYFLTLNQFLVDMVLEPNVNRKPATGGHCRQPIHNNQPSPTIQPPQLTTADHSISLVTTHKPCSITADHNRPLLIMYKPSSTTTHHWSILVDHDHCLNHHCSYPPLRLTNSSPYCKLYWSAVLAFPLLFQLLWPLFFVVFSCVTPFHLYGLINFCKCSPEFLLGKIAYLFLIYVISILRWYISLGIC